MHWVWTAAVLLFWTSVLGVVYAYALYPLILSTLARLVARRTGESAAVPGRPLPDVSLLIAAHDEEAVIGDRIRNALELDYPRDKMEIVVASDGSADRTAAIVQSFADRGVRLLEFAERRGKASVLNDAFGKLLGEIVMLSDANTFTDPDAALKLVRWFANPNVGAVCGKLILTDPSSGKNVDGVYWKYETFLKRQEGRLGALLGSNGAIYAIRKEFFRPIPVGTIIDDFVIPLVAKLRSGCDIVFDPEAVAREESAPDLSAEFRRRSRIGAGGWQAIGMLWPLLNPMRGWIAFTFVSHKVLRWACPFLMIVAFLANLFLLKSPFFGALLASQCCFYGLALVSRWVPGGVPFSGLLRLTQMFVEMNAALLVGFFRWASGPQTGMWARTRRQVEIRAEPIGQPGAVAR